MDQDVIILKRAGTDLEFFCVIANNSPLLIKKKNLINVLFVISECVLDHASLAIFFLLFFRLDSFSGTNTRLDQSKWGFIKKFINFKIYNISVILLPRQRHYAKGFQQM